MGIGQILSYATRRIKPNQIRIRKRELDASNNRSFASEFVSSDYEVTGLVATDISSTFFRPAAFDPYVYIIYIQYNRIYIDVADWPQ